MYKKNCFKNRIFAISSLISSSGWFIFVSNESSDGLRELSDDFFSILISTGDWLFDFVVNGGDGDGVGISSNFGGDVEVDGDVDGVSSDFVVWFLAFARALNKFIRLLFMAGVWTGGGKLLLASDVTLLTNCAYGTFDFISNCGIEIFLTFVTIGIGCLGL